jgi:hypothetical protein
MIRFRGRSGDRFRQRAYRLAPLALEPDDGFNSAGFPTRHDGQIMPDQQDSPAIRREELLNLLSTSGSLAGLCITIVAFMNTFDKTRASITMVDDMLAMCAAAFLLCIYLIFWALRSRKPSLAGVLIKVVDAVFLLATTSMTVAAFIMIYTIW